MKISKDSTKLHSSNSDIKSRITYSAEDSIVYDLESKKMYLFNQSKIDYTDMLIEAYFIDYDWTTGVLAANQYQLREDSILGRPYMKQDGKEYFTDKLLYNFKSKKGKVYDIVTKEEEALLHGHEVKKDSIGNWFISKAKYTTCDLEHPHFYFNAKKLKLTNKKSIITGPTNLVINDVQTPLYLPFGIFPAQKGRRSGVLFPQEYGFSPFFNLQRMGFYIGINDYTDVQFLSDIYFNGSYKFNSLFRYNKKYHYTGSFTAETNRIFQGDADDPAVREKTPANYIFNWTHSQDPKAHPTFTFNSSLTYMTQGAINRSLTLNQQRIVGQIASNLNATKRFRKLPIIINGGIGYTQDLAKESISGYFPSLRINYNGNIYENPNKQKSVVIGLQYSTDAIAQLNSTPDSNLFNGEFLNKLSMGVKHSAIFSFQNIRLFKHFSFIPNLNYNDRFYFKNIQITRDAGQTSPDTTIRNGFFTARDFSGGVNLNTVVIGILPISKKGFLRGIKHQFNPNINFNYSPNFGSDFWGYFNTYNDTANNEIKYFNYQGPYTDINQTENAILSFNLSNAFEGKFKNRKDSIKGTQKKMLLDALSLSGDYDLIADSFKLSNINISFSNSTLRFLRFTGSFNYSPYVWENGLRKDKLRLSEGEGFLQFLNMNATASLTLNSNNFSKNVLNSDKGTEFERDLIYRNYQYFYDFNSPWNLDLSFNIGINKQIRNILMDTVTTTASILLNNFDFNITPKWKIGISSGYDFSSEQVGLTRISAIRDMHCWEFRVNYIPISNIGQAYTIEIRPKSAILQDLKLTRNKPAIENFF